MASLLDAINAAAAALNAGAESVKSQSHGTTEPRVKPRVQPKSATSGSEERRVKSEEFSQKVKPKGTNPEPKKVQPRGSVNEKPQTSDIKHQTSQEPKADTPKSKGGASYVIPKEFKQAIETYLNSRADMRSKLSAKGKSLDGCCDYIFDVMRKRAEKNRGGKSAVGMYVDPQEVFGLAVHYYDESEESLKAELNGK